MHAPKRRLARDRIRSGSQKHDMEYFEGQKTIAGPPDRRTPSPCRRVTQEAENEKLWVPFKSAFPTTEREDSMRADVCTTPLESLRVRLQRAVYVLDHGLILTRRRRWRCSDRGSILGIWYSACWTVSARRLKSDNTEVRRRQSRPEEREGISTESGSAGKWPCAFCSSQCQCSSYRL